MKGKTIVKFLLFIILLLFPFVVLSSFDFGVKDVYSETYYAELGNMYNRLINTEENKIVVIGNSNVAFGVESKLFEELISDFDTEYTVINFGLYGSIGTKAMMDLAEEYIKENDIVILCPEEYTQAMSLYFSAKEMWCVLDCNREMYKDLDSKSKESLVGNYADYVSQKYKLSKLNSTSDLGVYAVSSFDERCDLTQYERDYNIMYNSFDENYLIDLKEVNINDDFFDYLNEYNDQMLKKGAKLYYSFSPMNKASVVNDKNEIEVFYQAIVSRLNFPVISDINNYILDEEWFYDSNFHLNTSGMKVRTFLLVEDLKNELGITSKTYFEMPEKPVKPEIGIEGEGDNNDREYFIYEKTGNYYRIVGLTEEGKNQAELVIPYQVDGIYISEFTKDVFRYNSKIKKITIQKNIKRIYDESFYGCEVLDGVYLLHDSPSEISVGFSLLVGTAGSVYIDNDVILSFINDYFWGAYQERLAGYEKD